MAMADFDLKHLEAAFFAASTRVREPIGDREQAISGAMEEAGVPESDRFIVSKLTNAIAVFGTAIREAERDEVELPGTEIK